MNDAGPAELSATLWLVRNTEVFAKRQPRDPLPIGTALNPTREMPPMGSRVQFLKKIKIKKTLHNDSVCTPDG